MLAACRVAGLPARYVSGHLVGEGGSHAWVEVLRPDPNPSHQLVEGWDPTHGGRTGAGHVTIAVGRDYADVAPMSGTYDGDGVASELIVTKTLTTAQLPVDVSRSTPQ
jgi:transglutaminase-like putative cysteine protease